MEVYMSYLIKSYMLDITHNIDFIEFLYAMAAIELFRSILIKWLPARRTDHPYTTEEDILIRNS
jgi:hypothetical protein